MTAREETETKRGSGEKETILLPVALLQNTETDLAMTLEANLGLRLHIMADLDVNPIHGHGPGGRIMTEEMKEEERYTSLTETETEVEKGHTLLEGLLHLLGRTVSLMLLYYQMNLEYQTDTAQLHTRLDEASLHRPPGPAPLRLPAVEHHLHDIAHVHQANTVVRLVPSLQPSLTV